MTKIILRDVPQHVRDAVGSQPSLAYTQLRLGRPRLDTVAMAIERQYYQDGLNENCVIYNVVCRRPQTPPSSEWFETISEGGVSFSPCATSALDCAPTRALQVCFWDWGRHVASETFPGHVMDFIQLDGLESYLWGIVGHLHRLQPST